MTGNNIVYCILHITIAYAYKSEGDTNLLAYDPWTING